MRNIKKQIEIFSLADFFKTRAGLDGIVLITDKPEIAVGQLSDDTKIYIVCRRSSLKFRQKKLSPDFHHAGFITFNDLGKDFLKDKLLLCFNYSGIGRYSAPRKKSAHLLNEAAIGIMCTPSGFSEKITRIHKKITTNKTQLLGKARLFDDSVKKNQLVSLHGRLMDARAQRSKLRVLAIMHIYNERDIIKATIGHLLSQGLDVHIIDNWSTDGTYELVQSLADGEPRITYERFPSKKSTKFELGKMLTRVTDTAKAKQQYDWVVLNDADEIRWSPWAGLTLQEAFSFIDSVGYNAVDYTVFNFVPTKEGFSEKDDLLTFFQYGEFGHLSGHFVQIKSWRNDPAAVLAPSGGHHISFPGLKIFPLKFFLGHYPVRSTKHALEKIFKERKPRYAATEKKRGWHTHYDDLAEDTSFIGNPAQLIKFDHEEFYRDYLLERISGIGVARDPS
jgi:glycosyltransferase involved in cell wall biosynthesis